MTHYNTNTSVHYLATYSGKDVRCTNGRLTSKNTWVTISIGQFTKLRILNPKSTFDVWSLWGENVNWCDMPHFGSLLYSQRGSARPNLDGPSKAPWSLYALHSISLRRKNTYAWTWCRGSRVVNGAHSYAPLCGFDSHWCTTFFYNFI